MSYGGGYGADRFGDPSSYGSRAGFSGGPSGGYGGYGDGGGGGGYGSFSGGGGAPSPQAAQQDKLSGEIVLISCRTNCV